MGGVTILLVNCRPMEVSNLLGFLIFGEVDCRVFPISRIMLRPQGGSVVPIIPIRSGEEFSLIPQSWPMFPGVVLSTPILLTCHSVLLVHMFPDVASAKISFTAGIRSVYGVREIGFAGEGWKGTSLMVSQLNEFSSKIPFFVWINLSGLLIILPCASLLVALFN